MAETSDIFGIPINYIVLIAILIGIGVLIVFLIPYYLSYRKARKVIDVGQTATKGGPLENLIPSFLAPKIRQERIDNFKRPDYRTERKLYREKKR